MSVAILLPKCPHAHCVAVRSSFEMAIQGSIHGPAMPPKIAEKLRAKIVTIGIPGEVKFHVSTGRFLKASKPPASFQTKGSRTKQRTIMDINP